MSAVGKVRIGHKAPNFHCDAVIGGTIGEVQLSDYISESKRDWLMLLFIPAAFSFVCPTEVLAFHNCLDEFQERNCNVLFVSVDTKHSLWHWQNVPRQYGGLGQTDIALLSDAKHKMSKDFGVLIEEEGVCLRGLFIIDPDGIVQQITLNNLTVGRSVLEALRLLEAFQAVAEHGVLCPVDWKPSDNTSEMINDISNTLVESYEDRLANLAKEFGDTPVTDLDAKHSNEHSRKSSEPKVSKQRQGSDAASISSKSTGDASSRKQSASSKRERAHQAPLPRQARSASDSASLLVAPTNTKLKASLPPVESTLPPTTLGLRDKREPNPTTTSPTRPKPVHTHSSSSTLGHARNLYESRSGSHVVLEFADPTADPPRSPFASGVSLFPAHPANHHVPGTSASTPALSRRHSNSVMQNMTASSSGGNNRSQNPLPTPGGSQTRLQATFDAIKKMSAGLSSPRVIEAVTVKKGGGAVTAGAVEQAGKVPAGYFDVALNVLD